MFAPTRPQAPADGGAGAGIPAFRVDVNRDPWERIALLPGIGEARAKAIVARRVVAGPYTTLDDLDLVPGIGPATLEEIRDLILLGEGRRDERGRDGEP
jgi:competence protein ComEA